MSVAHYYRYSSHELEAARLRDERKIGTTNPRAQGSWYTLDRYEDPVQAQQQLALPKTPRHRIGPISIDMMPEFIVQVRTVSPRNGQPGGGTEVKVRGEILTFGCWEFNSRLYVF